MWQPGRDKATELLTAAELEQVTADHRVARLLLDDAGRHPATAAAGLSSGDLSGAYQLAYHALRKRRSGVHPVEEGVASNCGIGRMLAVRCGSRLARGRGERLGQQQRRAGRQPRTGLRGDASAGQGCREPAEHPAAPGQARGQRATSSARGGSEKAGSITARAADGLIEVVMGYLPGAGRDHMLASARTDHLNVRTTSSPHHSPSLQRYSPRRGSAPERRIGAPAAWVT